MFSRGDGRARPAAGRVITITVLLFILFSGGPAVAETTQSELVLIRAEDVVGEDLYALGQRIQVDGVVEGDLVALGLEEVRIGGRVTGSVLAVGGSVVVTGQVDGSLRTMARSVTVDGEVAGDLLVAGWTVDETKAGMVGRDLIGLAWRSSVDGAMGRNIEGRFHDLAIGGTVGGSVTVDASQVSVTPTGDVGEDLATRGGRPADISDGASVAGEILDRRPLKPNVRVTAVGFLFRILAGLGATLAGLALMWHDTDRVEEVVESFRRRRWAVLGAGVGAVVVPLFVIALLFGIVGLMPPSAGLPLLLFTIPVSLGVVTILMIGALLAPVPSAVRLGGLVGPSRSVFARFLIGMTLVTVLSFVPVVGLAFVAAVVIAGFGAWLVAPDEAHASSQV